ncbi:MAG: DUF4177 domain-containing protein [Rhodobacteraceae bacterium]|nr:DUF4177 domain-containing protein [Paracoccaceae bacterium]
MSGWEYKVVPAPARGEKAKGIKGAEARFAFALQRVMNEMGADGWEYQRSETLPSEERAGLASKVTTWRNVLVFRRILATDARYEDADPHLLAAPDASDEPAPEAAAPIVVPVEDAGGFGHFEAITPYADTEGATDRDPLLQRLEELRQSEDGAVEDQGRTQDVSDPGPVLRERAARMRGKDDDFAAE